jgi:ubiquitin carboxyl-terminal hydrolase 7
LIASDIDLLGDDLDNGYDEKQPEVANIEIDDADAQQEDNPPVTDHQAMFKKVLSPLPDLETLDETVFSWNVSNWRQLDKKCHSPSFMCGGHPWKILFFPFGNQTEYTSVYLEHGYAANEVPEGFAACVQFALVLSNPNEPTIYHEQSAKHRFQVDEGDWGFTRFVELRKVFSAPYTKEGRHLLEEGTGTLTAFVRVVKDPTGVLWHNFQKCVLKPSSFHPQPDRVSATTQRKRQAWSGLRIKAQPAI